MTHTKVYAAVVLASLGLAAPAFAQHGATAPKLVGNPTKGKVVFSSNCSACHTLKAAAALGNIGPNLDKVPLTEAILIKAVTNGGATVMTKAAAAKFTTTMVAYKGVLTATQIQDVAAFVYTSTHKS